MKSLSSSSEKKEYPIPKSRLSPEDKDCALVTAVLSAAKNLITVNSLK